MESFENIPEQFICPISLEIMQDPVIAITGITYDRENIEKWLYLDDNKKCSVCPVTKQTLMKDSVLTPNRNLRRLIENWCNNNSGGDTMQASSGNVQQFVLRPTVEPFDETAIIELVFDLSEPRKQLDSLGKLSEMASMSKSNCWCMVQSGVAHKMIEMIISSCTQTQDGVTDEVVLALKILQSLKIPLDYLKSIVDDYFDIFDSITWLLQHSLVENNDQTIRFITILVLNTLIEAASPARLAQLKQISIRIFVLLLSEKISQQATKAALNILLVSCPFGKNRAMIVEEGAVKHVIELELTLPDKRTTELNFGLLNQLCGCAAGRAQLISHAAGIAVISKRILRVSTTVDDLAVRILSSVCMYSVSNEMLQEMLRIGAVSKLCFVLQANCSSSVKDKARVILKLHSWAWKNAPCISKYLMIRYPCT